MSKRSYPYAAYSVRFPEAKGFPWVMAPELIGDPRFEILLRRAVRLGQPLSQAEVDKAMGRQVDWDEGVQD